MHINPGGGEQGREGTARALIVEISLSQLWGSVSTKTRLGRERKNLTGDTINLGVGTKVFFLNLYTQIGYKLSR